MVDILEELRSLGARSQVEESDESEDSQPSPDQDSIDRIRARAGKIRTVAENLVQVATALSEAVNEFSSVLEEAIEGSDEEEDA